MKHIRYISFRAALKNKIYIEYAFYFKKIGKINVCRVCLYLKELGKCLIENLDLMYNKNSK